MTIRNKILNDFEEMVRQNFSFKYVERGIASIDEVDVRKMPSFFYNSAKNEINKNVDVCANRVYFVMVVEFLIIDRENKNYYDVIDEYSENFLELLDKNEQFSDNILRTEAYIDEVVNDDKIDGLMALAGTLKIEYFKEI